MDDLPPAVCAAAVSVACAEGAPPSCLAGVEPAGGGGSLQQALQTPEKQIIVQTLKANKGNRQSTAAQLGINRTTLYKKMKKYGLLD